MSGDGVNLQERSLDFQAGAMAESLKALQAKVLEQEERLLVLERMAREALEQRAALERRLTDIEHSVGNADIKQAAESDTSIVDLEWRPTPPAPEPELPRIDLSALLSTSFRSEAQDENQGDQTEGEPVPDVDTSAKELDAKVAGAAVDQIFTGAESVAAESGGAELSDAELGGAESLEAEEWRPGSPVEAEEWNPESPEEAEEWKPESTEEAEEWRPESAEAVTERAEVPIDLEWKPAPSSIPDGEPALAALVVDDEPEISVRPGLLFKGRYTDVVWPQEVGVEERAELERCAALHGEQARADLDRIMRDFPYSWRIRQRLFELELAAGHHLYAYTAGWPLLYAPLSHRDKQVFREQMTGVIEALFSDGATASEERWKNLRLAELIMDVDPKEALARIREGLSQGEVTIEEESRLHYYRLCLADSCRESFDDCVVALQNIDGRAHLFDDLRLTVERYCPGHGAIVSLIDSLLHSGHEESKALEKHCNLGGEGFKPQLVETEHDEKADMLVELIFNQIYKRIPMPDVVSRTPEEEEILQQSEVLQSLQFPALGVVSRLNRKMFGVACDVRVYGGPKPFLAEIIVGETPTLVLHRNVAHLRPAEQQALLLRRLFQMHHRHHIIRRIHDVMNNEDRLVMMHALCQVAKDSGADPGAENMALLETLKPSESGFLDKLERLSNSITLHTGIFEFLAGRELMFAKRPFNKLLDGASDRFVARVVGMTEASYSVALTAVGRGELYDELMETGFSPLYSPANSRQFLLRLRLQRLWVAPLQEELWF